MEEREVFKIVYYYDDYGRMRYRWHNLKKEEWECSDKSFEDKGECLLNFILERVNFINQ